MSKIVKKINDIKLIHTDFNRDKRGLFYEIYNLKRYRRLGIKENFVQNSISISKKSRPNRRRNSRR